MSGPASRLKAVLDHLGNAGNPPSAEPHPAPHHPWNGTEDLDHGHNIHQLSPTFFLPRAASIEPEAEAIYHVAADGRVLRRSYAEFADRARGLAYYLSEKGLRRTGVLAPNTPAFLECIFGIAAAGGVLVPVNYRLRPEDVSYILGFADVDSVVVDREFEGLLDVFRAEHPKVVVIVDWVSRRQRVCPYPPLLPKKQRVLSSYSLEDRG